MNEAEPSLQVASAKQVVADAIRELIYDGSLELGSRVSIDGLAKRFGISRTPVRDALWHLSGEGLVSIAPRVGVTIRPIEDQEIADVYSIKLLLEPLSARWAAERANAEDRAQLVQIREALQAAAAEGQVTAYLAAIEQARSAVLGLADSDPLRASLAALDARIRILRVRNLGAPGHMADSASEYGPILDAIVAGDAELSYQLMCTHIEAATGRAMTVLHSMGAGNS